MLNRIFSLGFYHIEDLSLMGAKIANFHFKILILSQCFIFYEPFVVELF